MFKKLLNLSAASLCRMVANRPSPRLVQRTYANKSPMDSEDNANKYPMEPEDNANQIVVYSYPIPHRKSYIKLLQEANQLEKSRKEAKYEDQSPIPKEIESVAAKPKPVAGAKSGEKQEGCDLGQAKGEEAKIKSKFPALSNKILRRKTWHVVKELNEASAEDKKEEDLNNSDEYIVPKFQQLKFEGVVPYRKTKTDFGIKYEKVSATVLMHRLAKKF